MPIVLERRVHSGHLGQVLRAGEYGPFRPSSAILRLCDSFHIRRLSPGLVVISGEGGRRPRVRTRVWPSRVHKPSCGRSPGLAGTGGGAEGGGRSSHGAGPATRAGGRPGGNASSLPDSSQQPPSRAQPPGGFRRPGATRAEAAPGTLVTTTLSAPLRLPLPVPCPLGAVPPASALTPRCPGTPGIGVVCGGGRTPPLGKPRAWETRAASVRTAARLLVPPAQGLISSVAHLTRGLSGPTDIRVHGTLQLSSGAPLTAGSVFSPCSLWATTCHPGGEGGGQQGGPPHGLLPQRGRGSSPQSTAYAPAPGIHGL